MPDMYERGGVFLAYLCIHIRNMGPFRATLLG